ncbi:MAG: hypothetical protein NVSMB25_12010 [Thermoleophilaceae bacterium]
MPVASAHAGAGAWNRAEQRRVAEAGVMASLADGFHGELALSVPALDASLATVARHFESQPLEADGTAITVAGFDRLLVAQLGLGDLAASVQAEAARAGLHPPARFGTETVARALGLRFNHPARDDRLELYPTDPITRAEAAHSLARVMDLSPDDLTGLRATFATFQLPSYSPRQRRALSLAVSKIGMPYVWGGQSDGTAGRYGSQVHGGYDCSGFVWRVFKLSGDPGGRRIRGRTAAQMAAEIPRGRRIGFGSLAPADLLFFGPAGFSGRATEAGIVHVGIALASGWMIHSSDQGVYVSPLTDWRRDEFAWARHLR